MDKNRIASAKELLKLAREIVAANTEDYRINPEEILNGIIDFATKALLTETDENGNIINNKKDPKDTLFMQRLDSFCYTIEMLEYKSGTNNGYNIEGYKTKLTRFIDYMDQIIKPAIYDMASNLTDMLGKTATPDDKKFLKTTNDNNGTASYHYSLTKSPEHVDKLNEILQTYQDLKTKYDANKNDPKNNPPVTDPEKRKLLDDLEELFVGDNDHIAIKNTQDAFKKFIQSQLDSKKIQKTGVQENFPALMSTIDNDDNLQTAKEINNSIQDDDFIKPAIHAIGVIKKSCLFINAKALTTIGFITALREHMNLMLLFRNDKKNYLPNGDRIILLKIKETATEILNKYQHIKFGIQVPNGAYQTQQDSKTEEDLSTYQEKIRKIDIDTRNLSDISIGKKKALQKRIAELDKKIPLLKQKIADAENMKDKLQKYAEVFVSLSHSYFMAYDKTGIGEDLLNTELELKNLVINTQKGISEYTSSIMPGDYTIQKIVNDEINNYQTKSGNTLNEGAKRFFSELIVFLGWFREAQKVATKEMEYWRDLLNNKSPEQLYEAQHSAEISNGAANKYQNKKKFYDLTIEDWENMDVHSDFGSCEEELLIETMKEWITQRKEKLNNYKSIGKYIIEERFDTNKKNPQLRNIFSNEYTQGKLKTAGWKDWYSKGINFAKGIYNKIKDSFSKMTNKFTDFINKITGMNSTLNIMDNILQEGIKTKEECTTTIAEYSSSINEILEILEEINQELEI